MSLYPKYKVRQREVLAWIFVAMMKVQLEPPKVSIRHANTDFIRRIKQVIKLGTLRTVDLNSRKWELSNPKEIAFLMEQMKPYIHTQSDKRLATLLAEHCNNPTAKTEAKLKPLIKKHNINFYLEPLW